MQNLQRADRYAWPPTKVMENRLTTLREHCQADCRPHPLHPRRSMGSAQRICSNPILGSIRPHIHSEDEGRPIHTVQQARKNESPITANFIQQSSTSRLRARFLRGREHISWYGITSSLSSRNSTESCVAHESSSHIT